MATGHKDGAYFAYGQAYAERFRKEGFELALSQTEGSVDNLRLLTDEAAGVPVAFLQGGIGVPAEHPALRSLGSLYFEPIWIFVRGDVAPGRLSSEAHTSELQSLMSTSYAVLCLNKKNTQHNHLAGSKRPPANTDKKTSKP